MKPQQNECYYEKYVYVKKNNKKISKKLATCS